MPNTVSNGIPIGGYSIYLDGVRVHQILNPIASTVTLNHKLLFSGAKLLTIRALSLDGNAESKDSEPIHLSKVLMTMNQPSTLVNEKAIKPIPVAPTTTTTTPPHVAPTPQQQSQHTTSNNPLAGMKNNLSSLLNTVTNEVNAFNENSKKGVEQKPPTAASFTPAGNSVVEEKKQVKVAGPSTATPERIGATPQSAAKKTALNNIPRS